LTADFEHGFGALIYAAFGDDADIFEVKKGDWFIEMGLKPRVFRTLKKARHAELVSAPHMLSVHHAYGNVLWGAEINSA